MTIIIKALLLVVVAEMGDKTQLLAMAMAGKYKVKQVLMGVLVATIFNHALAVAAGSYLNSIIPMNIVKIVAAVLFLIFGLWTLRGDKIDEVDEKKNKFGPVVTVAIAFFLAEMGDKTQLMTITISAQSNQPIFILMGTTIGMLIADGIGIIGGAWMCKHIPEIYIKWIAGIIFIFFGSVTIYNAVSFWSPVYIILYILILMVLIYLFGVKFSHHSQVCNIALPNKNDPKDKLI
ncbi:TMEM165/GDT1 family protein [Clostridium sp. Mt-5]|uniref:GDT1 family protein n=1 Tax=Clostridium moutaii TaxID=3240932 RepID=A0ABV4BTV0_9CLOT